jgi:uncharacterized SAM-binding protein YcdF (DUF218 family)
VYFFLKALAHSLVLPPGVCLLFAAAGLLFIWRRWRFGWPLLLIGIVSLWLACTPIVADQLTRMAERYPPLDLSRPPGAQAVVILWGAGERIYAPEYEGPAADSYLLERIAYGAFLARRWSLPVLVSGTGMEATVMKTVLERDFGVQTRWVENQSRDTFENARFSAKLLQAAGIRRIILVTSSPHEWRAAHEFMGTGLEVVPGPAGMLAPREGGTFRFVPGPNALFRSNAALYELVGEPMRRLQALLGVREKFDERVAATGD